MLADGLGHLQHIPEVSATVLIGRRAYSREHNLLIVEHIGQRGGKLEAARLHILGHQFVQSGLIDGHFPFGKHFYFFFVDVHAGHFNAHLGETCTGNKADVTGANDSNFHKTLKMFS